MLRIILLSLIWAICSTCLVRPWFWKGVKNKNLFNDGVRIGFSNKFWKRDIAVEIVFFVVVFIFSISLYSGAGFRQNIYGSFLFIIICFITHCVWDNQRKVHYIIILTVAAINAIFWIQDGIVGCNINAPLNKVNSVPLTATKVDEDTDVKLFISSSEIQSLFKVDYASEPTYNNGKYIFTVSGGDNGNGVVVIDKDNYTEANFLPYSYEFEVKDVRSQYPTQKLKKLYIAISNDNVPYGIFAVAKKSWFLGTYKVNGYIMLNLMTGETTQELTQEELPDFVTNN